ncbi:RNA-directed DNA polymerase, eukaryota [Tanacetum coccineum]
MNYISQPKKVNEGIVKKSFSTILKTGKINTTIPPEPSLAIVLDDSCLMERDFSCYLMGKIKDINGLSNLYLILANEGFENVKLMYLGGFGVLLNVDSLASKEKIHKHVGFLIKTLTRNTYAKIISPWGELIDVEDPDNMSLAYRKICVKTKPNVIINDKIKAIVKGQVFWIRVKELELWTPDFSKELRDSSSHLLDHMPILMRELDVNYGPTLFRIYHFWFFKAGFDKLVEDTWKNSVFMESNNIINLKKKLQALKTSIKLWSKEDKQRSNASKLSIQSRLSDLDKMIDQGRGNKGLVKDRSKLLKELQDLNSSASLDMDQRRKFIGPLKEMKTLSTSMEFLIRSRLNWLFVEFSNPYTPRLILESQYSTLLSLDQKDDLKRNVSYDKIKRAVWVCGTNKSPRPDGFTFEFFRRYWHLIDQDVVAAVSDLFSSSKFPQGCISSFITLIPKTPDAKVIKDFHPISLIGSVYKIIAKILANRLSLVISDLISDVLSAFLADLPLKQLYPRLYALENDIHVSVAVKLRDSTLISSFRRAPRGGVEEEQFRLLAASTDSIIMSGINDRWVWSLESSGDFLVKSARSYIDDFLLPTVGVPTRWIKAVPIKINIFAWRVCLDELPTRLNLSLRGVDIPSILCLVCSINVESTSHLLFSCQVARHLLLKVARWWELEVQDWKWWWRARIEHEAIWVKVIKSIYGTDAVMGDFVGMVDGRSRELDDDDMFSVKKLSSVVEAHCLNVGDANFETVWNKQIPKKINVVAWRMVRDRLPVRVEFDRKGIDLHSVLCPMCDNACESIDHGIVLYSEVIKVWSLVFGWWHLGNVNVLGFLI